MSVHPFRSIVAEAKKGRYWWGGVHVRKVYSSKRPTEIEIGKFGKFVFNYTFTATDFDLYDGLRRVGRTTVLAQREGGAFELSWKDIELILSKHGERGVGALEYLRELEAGQDFFEWNFIFRVIPTWIGSMALRPYLDEGDILMPSLFSYDSSPFRVGAHRWRDLAFILPRSMSSHVLIDPRPWSLVDNGAGNEVSMILLECQKLRQFQDIVNLLPHYRN